MYYNVYTTKGTHDFLINKSIIMSKIGHDSIKYIEEGTIELFINIPKKFLFRK